MGDNDYGALKKALDRIDELGIEGRHAEACGAARAKAEELQKADKLNRDIDAAARRRDAVALARRTYRSTHSSTLNTMHFTACYG